MIVEDEFYLADDLAVALSGLGAKVVGPFGRVEDARRRIEAGESVEFAVLDIDLAGNRVFPLAEMLREIGAPFVFVTGYDLEIIPERFSDAPRIEKPVAAAEVIRLLETLRQAR